MQFDAGKQYQTFSVGFYLDSDIVMKLFESYTSVSSESKHTLKYSKIV